jgi:hypothetical protein
LQTYRSKRRLSVLRRYFSVGVTVQRSHLPDSALETVERLCLSTLRDNWCEGEREGVAYAFTRPSVRTYPWQWYWDSCFHAIVWARFDRARSRRELETLLAAARDGFIGHTIFWTGPVRGARRLFYNVPHRNVGMTSTIQPPLLAWAWSRVVGDPRAEPRIAAHHDWLRANRALEADGLLWIVQPDESGMDALPKFDHVWGSRAQGLPLFPLLVRRNRELGWDARRIEPRVCEVLTNTAWCLSELALGRPSLTPAIVDSLWDEDAGRFADREVRPHHALLPSERPMTWDTLAPLALPDLPDGIAERLVALYRKHFEQWVPLPAVAPDDPAHDRRERHLGLVRRHWRGPSWINAAWLVSLGLRRLGLEREAAQMAGRAVATVAAEGLREYYDSSSGRGMGAEGFGWSSLVLEMAEPSAPYSQLA